MTQFIPILLSIENSSSLYSISLSNGHYFHYIEMLNKNISSKYMLSLIDDLFIDSGIFARRINAISFGIGPGNFTNLKINASIIQSISTAWKIPVVKVLSLTAIALEMSRMCKKKYIFVITDAKTNYVYYNIYENVNYNIKPIFLKIICGLGDIKNIKLKFDDVAVAMNVPDEYVNIFRSNNPFVDIKKNVYPKAIYVDLLARKKMFMNKIVLPSEIIPLYLKKDPYMKYDVLEKEYTSL